MKCLILAAGYATRLYPLTENFPKPLLDVGGKTILDWLLDDLDATGAIDEYIVVTNHKFAEIFREWAELRCGLFYAESPIGETSASLHPSHNFPSKNCGPLPFKRPRAATVSPTELSAYDRNAEGQAISSKCETGVEQSLRQRITVLDDGTNSNETRLGAVKDIQFAIEQLGIDDDLLVMAGDNLLTFSLGPYIEYFKQKGTSCVMRYYEPEMAKLRKTGVLEIDAEDRIVSMEEKPAEPKSHWCCPPFYIYKREDLARVPEGIAAGCGTDAPGSFIAWLCTKAPVHAWPMPGQRIDIGSLESYEEARRTYTDESRTSGSREQ